MKTKKYIITAISFLIVLLLLPIQVRAADSIDIKQDVNLTISFQDENTSLTDAEFDLYLIATVDEYGRLTTTEAFRQFNVDIHGENDTAWKALASTLEGYVLRDGIKSTDSGKTDRQGLLTFPNQAERLEQGLYLVLSHRHIQSGRIYDAAPFMVLLPAQDKETNDWLYNVIVKPKYESRPEPNDPDDDTITRKVLKVWADDGHEKDRPKEVIVQLLREGKVFHTVTLNAANNWRYTWENLDNRYQWTIVEKELEKYNVTVIREGVTFVVTNTYTEYTPDEPIPIQPGKPTLPQTGQLWWPVPVLMLVGMLFVIIGLIRRRGVADEDK